MNVHIVQHNVCTNNPEENLNWILSELDSQQSKDALLTVFPACTLCGYPLFGSAAYADIQKRAQAALQRLVDMSEHRAFLVGLPLQIQDKGLCNAIVFVQNCAIRAIVTKKYLAPDEQKYFVRGEGVQSVNFQGDMGYVVTFRLRDPLFAIDLSDPAHPTLTDALEIDGYSSYMQSWTDGLLLGTGVTTDESGWENGVKLVMFDTSDPNELKECGIWSLSDRHRGIGSFAISNRKTLLIAPEKNLIAYPIVIGNKSSYLFFSYENGEFTLRGSLSNDTERSYAHYLDRAIYIGDYVYVLSDGNIISADMDTFTETDRLVMTGNEVTHEEADPEPVYYENGTMLNETPGYYSDDEYTDYEETSTSPEPEEYASGTGYEDAGSEPIGSSGLASEEYSAVSTGKFVRGREISVSGVSEP